MSTSKTTTDEPREFFSDEHRESHIGGLLAEKSGQEARLAGAELDGNEPVKRRAQARVSAVDAELERLGAAAKKPAQRAERR